MIESEIWPRGVPHVGQMAERSRTVTSTDIERFTEMSGDRNPLHYDEEVARSTVFGEIVVQGGVTSAILNAVVAEDLCIDFDRYGAGTLGLVTRVDVASGASQSHPCGTGLSNFDITPGEGLFLTPTMFPLAVQWTTY